MEFPFPANRFGDPQQRLLRGIPAFARLPAPARQALAAHLAEQSYPAFALILDEGEPADRLFLIEEGEVEVSIRTPEGRAPLSRLGEGEMFGEIGPDPHGGTSGEPAPKHPPNPPPEAGP